MSRFLLIVLFIFSNLGAENYILSDEQILGYEIPPSSYLEKLSEKQEKRARTGSKIGSGFMLGWGLLFVMSASQAEDQFPGPGFGYAMGLGCFALGAKSLSKSTSEEPLSLSKKRYNEVQEEIDDDKREIKAYNTLVWLAKSSKNIPERDTRSSNRNNSKSTFADLVASIFVESIFENHVDWTELINNDDNYKNQLQVLLQKEFKKTPDYLIISQDLEEGYTMGVYLCLGQQIYELDHNSAVPFHKYKTFTAISEEFEKKGKNFIFFGRGTHKIKKKAEQIACEIALKSILK